MTALAARIDAARAERGWSLQRLASEAGFGSAQHVQQKLRGAVRIRPEEIARIASALELDAIALCELTWPALAEADPVPAELRELLAGATDVQRNAMLTEARRILRTDPATGTSRVARRRTIPKPVHDELEDLGAAADTGTGATKGRRAKRPRPPIEDEPEV